MKTSQRPFNFSVRTIRAQDQERYEISIRGVIGQYFDDQTWTIKDTEEDVLNELAKIPEGKPIDVRINSPGGEVGCGLGIYNALSRRAKDITTYNDGYAFSAASIVMLAGSKRVSPPASLWMIHRAQGGVDGTGDDMRTMGEGMDRLDAMMANVYATVSGKKTKEEFLAMMKATTWLEPQQAIELGLATESSGEIDPDQGGDVTDAEKRVFASFEKTIPENLRARVLAKAPAARAQASAGQTAANQNQTKKPMKKITAALVAAGITVAIDAEEDAVLPHITALITDRTNLKAQLTGHETALKNRVTAKVEKAISDKLIKAERKDALIKAGMADETTLDFIDDIRAELAAKQPRGANPARRSGNEEAEDVETQIEANEAVIQNHRTDMSKRAETIRANLKLRGLDGIVRKPAAEAAAN